MHMSRPRPCQLLVALALTLASCERSPSSGTKANAPAAAATSGPPHRTAHASPRKPGPQTQPVPAAQVEAKVLEIMGEQLGVAKSELTRGMDLRKDLRADDLDLVELVMEIEDTFHLSTSDASAESWRTVGQVIDYARTNYKP